MKIKRLMQRKSPEFTQKFRMPRRNSLLKNVRERIAANEKLKQQMEDEYPTLVTQKTAAPSGTGDSVPRSRVDPTEIAKLTYANEMARETALNNEKTRVTALESRI